MKRICVDSSSPVRLDKYLMNQLPQLGLGRLNKALRENKIKLNGKKQPLSTRVQTGDEICLYIPDSWLEEPDSLRFVYRDEQVWLVNKPAGLPVDAPEGDSLLARARKAAEGTSAQPRLCHRLDTGTSGLVLLACTDRAETLLTDLIRRRELQKEYLCVTFGRPDPAAGVLGGYLSKDAQRGVVRIVPRPGPTAKPVETRYKTLAVSGRLALLQVQLITGRTHQIRAHMASIGCPILGDSKYGNNAANRELHFRYQALCAWRLHFPKLSQPELAGVSGQTFELPMPWYCGQVQRGELQ